MKKVLTAIAILFISVNYAQANGAIAYSVPKDTVQYEQEEDGVIPVDSSKLTRRNLATGLDAMTKTLDSRYLAEGHDFTDKWWDHMFLEAGLGVNKLVTYANDYEFAPLTTAHLALGKQFNRLHSARLDLHGEFGYLEGKNHFMFRYGARLDHLFSISSYFRGYDPARRLDVSSVIGVGVQKTHMQGGRVSAMSANMRLGAQFRFFTGPQGYLAFEPYYEMSTDESDLSEYRNFRRVDMSFGANISYIYYINNNLSKEAKKNHFDKLKKQGYKKFVVDEANGDTVPELWSKPWFVEFSNGLNFPESAAYDRFGAMGSDVSISVGKWLSPALAIRATGSMRTGKWTLEMEPPTENPYKPLYERERSSVYVGGRVEAVFNPFGLRQNFDWEDKFGAYAVAGIELGRMMKYQTGGSLSCRAQAYSAGAHLWTRLSDGLKLFVEPRYTHYVYKIPYRNVDWSKRFSDAGMSVNVGLTVTSRENKFRQYKNAPETRHAGDISTILSNMEIGVGGGVNYTQRAAFMKGTTKPVGFGGQVFATYRLNHYHGVRLGFEYARVSGSQLSDFYDLNMSVPESNYAPVRRNGLWDYNHGLGFITLSYEANLTNLLNGYRPDRFFSLSAYVGPSLLIGMGNDISLNASERLQEGHEAWLVKAPEVGTSFGFHGGLKLAANVSKHFQLYLSPTFNVLTTDQLDGVNFLRIRYLETLNLGVQYKF